MKEQIAGICPKCGSDKIDFGNIGILEDSIYYPCMCEACKCEFEEFYTVKFDVQEIIED